MDIKQIKILIEKYHNCETSVEEENQLKECFMQESIPVEFTDQKKYFQYLVKEKNIKLNNPDFEKQFFNKINIKQTIFQVYRTPLSIAASIVLLLTVYLLVPQDFLKKKTYFSQIEDTYEDPNQAYIEAKKALAFVAEKMETGTKQLNNIVKIDKGIQELNNIKKADQAVSKYGKMASINKRGQFILSF